MSPNCHESSERTCYDHQPCISRRDERRSGRDQFHDGSPRLPDPNPLARVDWRSVEVVIKLDEEGASKAADLINLQVEVAIATDTPAVEL